MSILMAEINSMILLGLFDTGSLFVLGILAILLFGGDLPKMGRKFGKIYSEFQRTINTVKSEVNSVVNDITSDINAELNAPSRPRSSKSSSVETPRKDDDEVEATAPKFEPPKK